jgi:hypothetical protein
VVAAGLACAAALCGMSGILDGRMVFHTAEGKVRISLHADRSGWRLRAQEPPRDPGLKDLLVPLLDPVDPALPTVEMPASPVTRWNALGLGFERGVFDLGTVISGGLPPVSSTAGWYWVVSVSWWVLLCLAAGVALATVASLRWG